jgi:hypothetical protein
LANTLSRMPFVANLSDQDVSRNNGFSAKLFDPSTLSVGITTVSAGTLSLFMGH